MYVTSVLKQWKRNLQFWWRNDLLLKKMQSSKVFFEVPFLRISGHWDYSVRNEGSLEGASAGKVEVPPVPKVIIKNQIETFFQNKWQIRWKNLGSCRQTKFWISKPGIMGKQIQMLGRATLSNVIQALTGHNYLNYHCSQMDRSLPETCRFCGEGHEEFIHLARECPALAKELAVCYWMPSSGNIVKWVFERWKYIWPNLFKAFLYCRSEVPKDNSSSLYVA